MSESELTPAQARMAHARASKRDVGTPTKAAAVRRRTLSDRARERAEEEAAAIPTTAEEYKRWERAVAMLKAAAPAIRVRVIRTPARIDQDTATPKANPRADEDGEMAFIPSRPKPLRNRRGEIVYQSHLAISGDDLADSAPGSLSRNFEIGDEVLLTDEAAERLAEQGWVEIL